MGESLPTILKDLDSEFESERLLIRVPRAGDGPMLNEAVIESLTELEQFMPWAKQKPSLEESEAFCREAYASFVKRDDIILFVLDRADQSFIGSSGLHRINWSVPRFEIGYWCRSSRTGRGYISESTYAIAKHAFEKLGAMRVEIRCDSSNLKSRKIPERLGFELDAVFKNHERNNKGELIDNCVYAMTSIESLKAPKA